MLDARDELTRRQARDPDEWSWGALHRRARIQLLAGGAGERGLPGVRWHPLPQACEDGLVLGRRIGERAVALYLQPVKK